MDPGLKRLGLCLVATPWATGALLSFQKPSAIDPKTSRRGPRGRMKNGDAPAHPQVYDPISRRLGPRIHDGLGTLSPSPRPFGSRRRRGAPFRFAPQSLTGEPFSVLRPSRTVPWPRVRSSCGTTMLWASQSLKREAATAPAFPPRAEAPGLPRLKARHRDHAVALDGSPQGGYNRVA